MADEAPLEPRVAWLSDRICGLLRAKPELFKKLFDSEEEGEKIKSFVNDSGKLTLFFWATAKEMNVGDTIPPQHKKKVVYLQKTSEVALDAKSLETLFDQVIVGDLNAQLLESYNRMLRHVYHPLITGSGLADVAAKALSETYQHMLAALVVAIGQSKGKTLLPLPPNTGDTGRGQMSGDKDRQDKDRVHVLETAVVHWTDRINTALSKVPESVFENDKHPGPLAGVEFWRTKGDDLSDILAQLNGPQIHKVRPSTTSRPCDAHPPHSHHASRGASKAHGRLSSLAACLGSFDAGAQGARNHPLAVLYAVQEPD